MKGSMMRLITVMTLIILSACSNQSMYEAIQQNQCLEETGNMYCHERERYDEYKRKRDELLKEEQSSK